MGWIWRPILDLRFGELKKFVKSPCTRFGIPFYLAEDTMVYIGYRTYSVFELSACRA